MVKRKRRKGAPKISGPKTHKVQSGNQSSVEEVKTGTDYGKKNTIFKPNEKKNSENESLATNSFMQDNYHAYKPLGEGWRSMNRAFEVPNEADIKYIDKLCDDQLKSVSIYCERSVSLCDTQVNELSNREDIMDATKRLIMSSSVCPCYLHPGKWLQ